MIIQDRVYGAYTIKEPILLELLESPTVQRIKGINQYGIPDKYFYVYNFSRYEHCVGVMILLDKLGATIEEQIAGLLHDVSHMAFSHTFDWVIGTNIKEEYADTQHKNYLLKMGIDKILQKYGYDFDRIANPHHFTLLEKETPDLCADRVDYALRECTFNFPLDEVQKSVQNFTNHNGQIVCQNRESALWFGEKFLWHQIYRWGSFEGVSRFRWFAKALKYGIDEGTITLEDFTQDDNFVVSKLEKTSNPKIHKILSTLKQKSLSHLALSTEITNKKFRYVDPLFLDGKNVQRLSEVDKDFREKLEQARNENNKGIILPTIE